MSFNFDLTVTLSLLFTIFFALIGWVRMRNAAVDKRIDACGERLDRHEGRLQSAEQTLQMLPGKDDFHTLSLTLAEMRGDMREIRAVMDGNQKVMVRLESIVTRHEDHLLDGAKR